jgi:menaquinone-dependent protoporphyrinogen oxidase
MPSAFYSVSLTAASDDADSWQELRLITEHFLSGCHWTPTLTEYMAGALYYTKYDFFKKFIMRQLSKRHNPNPVAGEDREYTDWDAVSKFALRFEETASCSPVTVEKPDTDFEAIC